jgi:hypothetical protein
VAWFYSARWPEIGPPYTPLPSDQASDEARLQRRDRRPGRERRRGRTIGVAITAPGRSCSIRAHPEGLGAGQHVVAQRRASRDARSRGGKRLRHGAGGGTDVLLGTEREFARRRFGGPGFRGACCTILTTGGSIAYPFPASDRRQPGLLMARCAARPSLPHGSRDSSPCLPCCSIRGEAAPARRVQRRAGASSPRPFRTADHHHPSST